MTAGRATYPLTGVRVLDLSRILAGPVCTQLLADLGAEVVKVERPGAGDDTRQWGPPFVDVDGPSAYFISANRGKRSLALDLAHPSAREVVDALVARADVLVENFRTESLEKLGLVPERLERINPRLVSCSISGFGRTGPLRDAPGYDLAIQAHSGLMSITGEPEGMPSKVGVAITDVITGLYEAVRVLTGLYARDHDRPGRVFDLALADCTLASLVNIAQAALVTGERPKRYGNAHPQIVPYESFATQDGQLVVGIGSDRQWKSFCKIAERDDLAGDERYQTNPLRVTNRDVLIPELQELFGERSTAAWRELLRAAGVPHAPVLAVDEVLASEQVAAREMVLPVRDSEGHEFRLLGSAVHWQGEPPRSAKAPPALGQHTDEVLREWLDFGTTKITDLRTAGVIG